MSRITITFEFPEDGGVVLYSDNGGMSDMQLVFAGNQTEALDYVGKRVSGFSAPQPVKKEPTPELRKAYNFYKDNYNAQPNEVYAAEV